VMPNRGALGSRGQGQIYHAGNRRSVGLGSGERPRLVPKPDRVIEPTGNHPQNKGGEHMDRKGLWNFGTQKNKGGERGQAKRGSGGTTIQSREHAQAGEKIIQELSRGGKEPLTHHILCKPREGGRLSDEKRGEGGRRITRGREDPGTKKHPKLISPECTLYRGREGRGDWGWDWTRWGSKCARKKPRDVNPKYTRKVQTKGVHGRRMEEGNAAINGRVKKKVGNFDGGGGTIVLEL